MVVWRSGSAAASAPATSRLEQGEAIGWPRRLRWLCLALVPSGLLLAVTTHITTDLAAVPLLWVVPLALYLLTYVIAFARRPWLRHVWMLKAQPFVLIPLVLLFTWTLPFWVGLPLHLLCLFVSALVCHGELARLRPRAEHLTEFYFWLALGGALGGAFTALLAPLLFDGVFEYPIALAAACLLRPMRAPEGGRRAMDFILPLTIGALIAARGGGLDLGLPDLGMLGMLLVCVPSAVALYALAERPLGFGLGIAAALAAALLTADGHMVVARERSFFGVYTVKRDPAGYHVLVHGTTVHGAQSVDPSGWREPLTYYHRDGPLGHLFSALGARPRAIGVVGLGAGAVACYRRPGQRWTFYEIDPLVERIARDQRYFHYLAECAPDAAIRSGDARLTLQDAAPASYDLLILDAFSSDAIPMHLITREALALYLDKLAPGGVIAWHVSNRNLDLAPIVADLAADAGVVAWGRSDQPSRAALAGYRSPSSWIALARRAEDLAPLARRCAVDPAAGPARRAALDRRLLQPAQRAALATAPLSTNVFAASYGRASADGRDARGKAGSEPAPARLGHSAAAPRELGRPRHRGSGRASARGRGHQRVRPFAPDIPQTAAPRPPIERLDDPGRDAALPGITARSC